jgi:hypothetical protein
MSKLSISEIDKKIKELQEARVLAEKTEKADLKDKIDNLISESIYSLEDLYPRLNRKTSISKDSNQVKINDKTYKLPKSGLGKKVSDQLIGMGYDLNDYNRENCISEFGI